MVLVEDLFNVTLPDFKGNANSPGRQRTQREDGSAMEPQLRRYCEYSIRVLKGGFGEDKRITARVFHEMTRPITVSFDSFRVEPEFSRTSTDKSVARTGNLRRTRNAEPTWSAQGKQGTEVSIIVAWSGYMIIATKPPPSLLSSQMPIAIWTRSMGLYDADEVATDFMWWQTTSNSTQPTRK